MNPRLKRIKIQGYRPFGDFQASLGSLEVLIGANGAGKSSLFEFLKFLRDSLHDDIPPEIISGAVGQQIFHAPGPERFQWDIEIDMGRPISITYQGQLLGPIGKTRITYERIQSTKPLGKKHKNSFVFMDIKNSSGVIYDPESLSLKRQEIVLKRPNQLALGTVTNPALVTLYDLREHIRSWRFYSSFNINNSKIRKSILTEQEPILHEDAGNLSSLLFYLMTEHQSIFDELQQHLRSVIAGFKGMSVKARGGPGEVGEKPGLKLS
ncbi:AAA family ATPase [Candidatus Cyanaurora vandensis]|uniref:AAA family ATPase n=1 Tax=Candidatus Cyanaurora vandensis TaxID=2714958 RepID=UPI00257CF2D3|nr:AAA family ATPase [Candidatus Cyanaurora vandensis]